MNIAPHFPDAQKRSFVALSGGVGGAKMALGLSKILPPSRLNIVSNTGDDFEHLGFHISPDIDTVLYTLAGLSNTELGWGRANETWTFMDRLKKEGGDAWFQLGDKDLELHRERAKLLSEGRSLSDVTDKLAKDMGIEHDILPMCDEPVRTIVQTDQGPLAFQHYFVREQCRPEVRGFFFDGIEMASVSDAAQKALQSPSLGGILLCPSNPFVSIDPILNVPGMRELMKSSGAPIVAVSPIVGGTALKGPAAKMMVELGIPSTAAAVAEHYRGFIDALIIDSVDADLAPEIEAMGIKALVTNTVMKSLEDRVSLAQAAVDLAGHLAMNVAEGARS